MKKLVLIGDSIRMSYQGKVTEELEGRAEVWGPKENCRYSLWVLEHCQEWIIDQKPDVLHFNCGLHDQADVYGDGTQQIFINQYRISLQRLVRKLTEALPGATLIWATLTPWLLKIEGLPIDQWPVTPDIARYNKVALEVMGPAGIPVNDLNKAITDHGHAVCIQEDGVHLAEQGIEVASDAVVKTVSELAGV